MKNLGLAVSELWILHPRSEYLDSIGLSLMREMPAGSGTPFRIKLNLIESRYWAKSLKSTSLSSALSSFFCVRKPLN